MKKLSHENVFSKKLIEAEQPETEMESPAPSKKTKPSATPTIVCWIFPFGGNTQFLKYPDRFLHRFRLDGITKETVGSCSPSGSQETPSTVKTPLMQVVRQINGPGFINLVRTATSSP